MLNYDAVSVEYRERIELRLDALTSDGSVAPVLSEAMRYSLLSGGKRLRAMLLLECCRLFGGDEGTALDFACAVEMLHAYSLIHDDLPAMDNDDMRRGKPSNHKVFGEAIALLAGDALLNLAYETMLLRCINVECVRAASAIAHGAGVSGMISGQTADILALGSSANDLKYIHTHKTGALISASVLAGAYIGHANEQGADALREFGERFGLLFQITDDILDVCGDAEELGKSVGKDAAENKLTYPSIYGVKRSRELAREAAEAAINALASFGNDAEWLRETVRRTLVRTK